MLNTINSSSEGSKTSSDNGKVKKKESTKTSFDLNATERGALKHAIQVHGRSFAQIQKNYFPNYDRIDIKNFVNRNSEFNDFSKKSAKALKGEHREKFDRNVSKSVNIESEEERSDEDEEDSDDQDFIINDGAIEISKQVKPRKNGTFFFQEDHPIKDRPFCQRYDLVESNEKPYQVAPAELLSSPKNYHVIYRYNKGQTLDIDFSTSKSAIQLLISNEPLFASEYEQTEASKSIPKPKKERFLSLVPISFPNDASIGQARRLDYSSDIGRLTEVIIPRSRASNFTLAAPLHQKIRPRDIVITEDDDSPPPKIRKFEAESGTVTTRTNKFKLDLTKETIEVNDKVQIWYDDEGKYFIGTIVSHDPKIEKGNTTVKWGNHVTEVTHLSINDRTDDPSNKDRWCFLITEK